MPPIAAPVPKAPELVRRIGRLASRDPVIRERLLHAMAENPTSAAVLDQAVTHYEAMWFSPAGDARRDPAGAPTEEGE